jgi:hypothetical protein
MEGLCPTQSSSGVCREGAFRAAVDAQTYREAQKIVEKRLAVLSNYQVLDQLSSLLKREGRLSATIINKDRETPCVDRIMRGSKSLHVVYELIGYSPEKTLVALPKGVEHLRQSGYRVVTQFPFNQCAHYRMFDHQPSSFLTSMASCSRGKTHRSRALSPAP